MVQVPPKQDSNFTELRYAVEVTPGVVDSSVSWIQLEPNDYKSYGGDVKTKARMPINASRQLKKGVVVDLDANVEFAQDLTITNFEGLAPSFFFAAMRTKDELTIATVDGTGNDYEPASGGDGYYAGDLLFAKDFSNAENNGLKSVTGTPLTASVPVTDTGLVDETGATGKISRVGLQFGVGALQVDVSGALPKLVSTIAAADGDLVTDNTNAADTSTVTINGIIYTFQSTLTAGVAGNVHVHIGGSADATLLNLARAINNSGGTPGTDYSTTGTGANPYVTSSTSVVSHTITLTAITGGVTGNKITTVASTSPNSHITPEAATLTGGTGRAFSELDLIPGEFVFLGSDETNTKFAGTGNYGYCRVRDITASNLIFDKTQFEMTADSGTGKNVRLYFGRVIKNEHLAELIVPRYIQFERTMGAPDLDQPTEIQAEYVIRALADKLKFGVKTADILTMDMSFVCSTNELLDGSTGLKAGSRPELLDTDAFNATSDVVFTRMAIVDPTEAAPTPLFSYFTDLTIDLNNNIKQNKAVSVLGAFSSTAGFFQVKAALQAYFINVAEIQAVKDNDSITLETHLSKFNAGVSIDIPLMVLSKAMADVKINEPIMIPLDADAATAKFIDVDLDHTLLMVFWDYLPDLARP